MSLPNKWRYPLGRPSEIQETMGPKVRRFEHMLAEHLGFRDAIMVTSGAVADLLLCRWYRECIESDLERPLLISAVTFPSQVWAATWAGWDVELVDVNAQTLNAETPLEGDLFAVHLLGNPGPSGVFDDCCEAFGSRLDGESVGKKAANGCAFSFYYSHQFSTVEGGAVLTDHEDLALWCRLARDNGLDRIASEPFTFVQDGLNFRPLEIQGEWGLKALAEWPEKRTRILAATAQYDALVGRHAEEVYAIKTLPGAEPVWLAWPFVLKREKHRSAVLAALREEGIETRPMVAGNLLRQPVGNARHGMDLICENPLPGADYLHENAFYVGLGIWSDEERRRTFGILDRALAL